MSTSHDSRVKHLESLVHENKLALTRADDRSDRLEAENLRLVSELAEANSERYKLIQEVEQLRSANLQLECKIKNLEGNQERSSELLKQSEDISKLMEDWNTKVASREQIFTSLKRWEASLHQSNLETQALKEERDNSQGVALTMERELSDCKAEISSLQNKLSRSEIALSQQKQLLDYSLTTADAQIKAVEAKYDSLAKLHIVLENRLFKNS